jgi:uncharacterized protein
MARAYRRQRTDIRREASPFRVARSRTGLGLFAVVAIERGVHLLDYVGPRISNAAASRMDTKYLFELDERWTVDGSDRRNIARYINHSCQPNAEVRLVRRTLKIFALKRILPGQEITYDYGEEYFDAYIRALPCQCARCRAGAAHPGSRERRHASISRRTSRAE